ncbi:MAG: hypothetical protein AB7F86_03365 [Bdellovibrionales bacterium]
MLRWFLIRFTLISLCAPVFGQEIASDDFFQKGLAAYQNKQYQEAKESFQSLIDGGRFSTPLLHNLALSYFQLDQKAYAMALWRKALSIDPDFRPAREGRDFLERKFNMRPLENDSATLWTRRQLEQVSIHEILWLVALTIAGVGFLWLRYFGGRKIALEDDTPMPQFPVSAVVLSGFLIALLAVTGAKWHFGASTRATIVVPHTSVKSLPAAEGVGLFELPGGSEVLVMRQNDDWLQVQNSDGASGWVKSTDLLITDSRRKL